jgi:hypothetical protein
MVYCGFSKTEKKRTKTIRLANKPEKKSWLDKKKHRKQQRSTF